MIRQESGGAQTCREVRNKITPNLPVTVGGAWVSGKAVTRVSA